MPHNDRLEDALDRIEAIAPAGSDWSMRLEVAYECCWSCELRFTLKPNSQDGPDRSLVTFAASGGEAADAALRAVDEMERWMGEGHA